MPSVSLPSVTKCWRKAEASFGKSYVQQDASYLVEERTPGQPFFLAAIEELLRLAGDPDSAAFYTGQDSFAKGVRLGVGVELPRVPAVFTAKDRWRSYPEGPDGMVLRDNYVSAKEHAAEVQKQFEIEAELGAMFETDLGRFARGH